MTLLQYEIFKTVIDSGSFTKAGEKLGLTQSAISHAVRGLESELELTLLKRGRSGVSLTSEGERIIEFIRQTLNLSEKMKQEAGLLNGLEVGVIRIGTFPSVAAYLLPSILEKFQSEYPKIQVEFYEGGYNELKQMVSSNIIDVSFLTNNDAENLDFIPLFDDHLHVILPSAHPFTNKKKISIQEIASHPIIMPKAGCDELIKELFKKANLKPNVYCEIADNQTIIAMVQKNLGISIVPEIVMHGNNNLNSIELKEESFRTIGLALPNLNDVSPAVAAFIELTRSMINRNK
ncbi:LysR substrate-binding domain-containing protein [Alteribacillus bidgolensis]|uniref:DNA-binding transcriptional regulator, LysR family n=1 Tax=Alteribacillus bidgolensis TaxID=930129 RepID=A0A1G8JAQ8_9BACI|nr:LysR substrate-binding domain-containing protein [Alteribacillus bidgolensis]SDI27710.1 DNA-binding transcriptional regulator, LysR family [Alteribacillus bidgolensis]